MLTSFDKALAALIMAALNVWNLLAPWKIGLDEATVTMILQLVSPLLVYVIPNKRSVK